MCVSLVLSAFQTATPTNKFIFTALNAAEINIELGIAMALHYYHNCVVEMN